MSGLVNWEFVSTKRVWIPLSIISIERKHHCIQFLQSPKVRSEWFLSFAPSRDSLLSLYFLFKPVCHTMYLRVNFKHQLSIFLHPERSQRKAVVFSVCSSRTAATNFSGGFSTPNIFFSKGKWLIEVIHPNLIRSFQFLTPRRLLALGFGNRQSILTSRRGIQSWPQLIMLHYTSRPTTYYYT